MAENTGCGYIFSKAGILKLLVLIAGAATWALYASSGMYRSPSIKTYVLAIYIIAWVVSLLIYFFILTGLYLHIQSSCMSFNAFDYFWAWIGCVAYISSTIILVCYFTCDPLCGNRGYCACARQLTTVILGIVTAILYALEAQNMKGYAPAGAAYGTSGRGIWRMIILVVGAAAFGILIRTGYRAGYRCNSDCGMARTFVLIAWCVAWSVAALFYLLRLFMCPAKMGADRQVTFGTFEFFWSAFACLLYLVGAAVLAAFLGCSSFGRRSPRLCKERLSADILGWITAILFGIDAYFIRNYRPVWMVSRRRVEGTSGRNVTVTTTTTERRTRS